MGENYFLGNAPLAGNPSRVIEVKMLNAINAGGGGGGSPAGSIPTGNYGGGQPSFTPTTSGASAIDTSNGRVWFWFNNVWN